MKELFTIEDVLVKSITLHSDERGTLGFLHSEDEVPYTIERTFFVTSSNKKARGSHAHKECWQSLLCLQGGIDVSLHDGSEHKVVNLSSPESLLVIPPTIWAKQVGLKDSNLLIVFCSHKYDSGDYLHSIDDLNQYRKSI